MWTAIGTTMDSPAYAPTQLDVLTDWCTSRTSNQHSDKDNRMITTLGMWTLWKHQNAIMFDGATPSLHRVIDIIHLECRNWKRPGLIKDDLDHFIVELARWISMRDE